MVNISKEEVAKNVLPRIINRKANKEFLKSVPNRNFLDLSIVYYISCGCGCFVITNELMQLLEINEAKLYRWGNKNQKNDSAIFPLMQFMYGIQEDKKDEEKLDEPMYVLTNKNLWFGASMVLNKKMMEEISSKMDDDILMIPSSIHEWILVPLNSIETEEVDRAINFVNQTTVKGEEILSDHKYVYKRELKKIKIA